MGGDRISQRYHSLRSRAYRALTNHLLDLEDLHAHTRLNHLIKQPTHVIPHRRIGDDLLQSRLLAHEAFVLFLRDKVRTKLVQLRALEQLRICVGRHARGWGRWGYGCG